MVPVAVSSISELGYEQLASVYVALSGFVVDHKNYPLRNWKTQQQAWAS